MHNPQSNRITHGYDSATERASPTESIHTKNPIRATNVKIAIQNSKVKHHSKQAQIQSLNNYPGHNSFEKPTQQPTTSCSHSEKRNEFHQRMHPPIEYIRQSNVNFLATHIQFRYM